MYRKPSHRTRARRVLARGIGCLALALTAGCNMFTVQQDIEMGTLAFEEVRAEQPTLESGPQADQVRRVTDRLVESAKELHSQIANQFPWEVTVIDDDTVVNAFCLPGGKMAVYTGILPITQDDTGLAVVMGHEIAHAIERHGTERLTLQTPIDAAISTLTKNDDQVAIAQVVANLGVGLPWSRSNELEADAVGLRIMANAGYDPRQAVELWRRMAELSGGKGEGISEYFSTHPANSSRIEQIQELLPDAMTLYEGRKKALAPQ